MIPRLNLKLVSKFREIYGQKGDVKLYFAPGRVTLIGEHIDYSGGSTITYATDRGTYMVARKRNDDKVNIYSVAHKLKKSFKLEKIEKESGDEWLIYFKGVARAILEKGKYPISGVDVFLYTELPFSMSLASSSSLCACFTYALLDINSHSKVSPLDMAKLSYSGEIMFASQRTSLSDHITIFLAKEKSLIHLTLRTLEYEYIDFELGDYSLAVVNSNKKRMSSDSEYNSRKRECDSAVKKINEKKHKIDYLCELKLKDLKTAGASTLTGKEQRRAQYAIMELERVQNVLEYIKKNSMKDIASTLVKTHNGLSTLYEVTNAEIDILVEEAMKIEGVLGVRMIGTGFGGGVLMIIQKSHTEAIMENLYTRYKERTRRDADVYIMYPSKGARVLPIE